MNIILVFPKPDTAKKLKNVLRQAGYEVDATVSTVAQALQAISEYDSGIIVCNYRFIDGMAVDIYENASNAFQFLMIGPKDYVEARAIPDIFSLTTPLHAGELLSTMEVMSYAYARFKKKMRRQPRMRSVTEQQTIERAKLLLMERNGMSEPEAHRYLQKASMDNGTGVVETAGMIMSLMSER